MADMTSIDLYLSCSLTSYHSFSAYSCVQAVLPWLTESGMYERALGVLKNIVFTFVNNNSTVFEDPREQVEGCFGQVSSGLQVLQELGFILNHQSEVYRLSTSSVVHGVLAALHALLSSQQLFIPSSSNLVGSTASQLSNVHPGVQPVSANSQQYPNNPQQQSEYRLSPSFFFQTRSQIPSQPDFSGLPQASHAPVPADNFFSSPSYHQPTGGQSSGSLHAAHNFPLSRDFLSFASSGGNPATSSHFPSFSNPTHQSNFPSFSNPSTQSSANFPSFPDSSNQLSFANSWNQSHQPSASFFPSLARPFSSSASRHLSFPPTSGNSTFADYPHSGMASLYGSRPIPDQRPRFAFNVNAREFRGVGSTEGVDMFANQSGPVNSRTQSLIAQLEQFFPEGVYDEDSKEDESIALARRLQMEEIIRAGRVDRNSARFLFERPAAQSKGLDPKKIKEFPVVKIDRNLLSKSVDKLGSQHCTICLEEWKLKDRVTNLPCSHSFHKECIEKWLKGNCKCPLDNLALDGPNS
eukprot:TRINITY_DN10433_c0_g1_i1.p1 TRINITY_DN10433_c0_g1~~TRINITY_DN10433_c0_g1_i1.p1  ORF type:complete len:611 (-),score=112.27 TRINITY_DN10433_c0_g1_i1:441-2009(-)